jgi:hypothetical protein
MVLVEATTESMVNTEIKGLTVSGDARQLLFPFLAYLCARVQYAAISTMSDSDSDTSSSLEAFPDAPPLTSLPDESAQSVLSGSTGLDSMASINRHILGMTQGSGETQFMSFTHRVSARRASEPVTMFSHFDREDSMGVFDSFVEDLHERAGDITQETIA